MSFVAKILKIIISAQGPGRLFLSFICLFVFSEVTVMSRNFRINTRKGKCCFKCNFPNKAALYHCIWGLTIFLRPRCAFLESACLAKMPGNKHKLQPWELCSGANKEDSQLLYPFLQPAVSLEASKCRALRNRLSGKKIERDSL